MNLPTARTEIGERYENTALVAETTSNPSYDFPKYQVQIEELHVGYLLRVGCQNIAVPTTEDLVKILTAFFTDKERVIREYDQSSKSYQSILDIVNQ